MNVIEYFGIINLNTRTVLYYIVLILDFTRLNLGKGSKFLICGVEGGVEG